MSPLRSLTPTDAKACATLHKDCFESPWSMKDFSSMLENPVTTGFGYYHHNHLVGLILYTITVDEAEIYTLCTHPDFRRMQIAQKLLTLFDTYCLSALVVKQFLEVSVSNIITIKLYEKMGYVCQTIRKNYYNENGVLKDAYMMVKMV